MKLKAIFHKINKIRLDQLYFIKQPKWKLIVGSGGTSYDESWLATDIDSLDITRSSDWLRILLFRKIDNILAEHVWEHLTEEQTFLANKNCFRFLKKGGVLRIAVPDGFHPDSNYIEHVRPGGIGPGALDHKILYNYKSMKFRLEEAGFSVVLQEFWDEFGVFHYTDWTDEFGHIQRSRRFDQRNLNGDLRYTSLIVDAIKN